MERGPKELKKAEAVEILCLDGTDFDLVFGSKLYRIFIVGH